MASSVTGWFSGAPRSFQSGISSVRAIGSMMAPDRMCAPGSEPFSSTTTDSSLLGCGGQLLEVDRRGQAGGAAADDDHVVFHGFARAELRDDFFMVSWSWAFRWCREGSRGLCSAILCGARTAPRAIIDSIDRFHEREKPWPTASILSGRVAFITGASGGLGAQFARTLAGAGAAVVLASRRVEKLKELRAEIEAPAATRMWSNST